MNKFNKNERSLLHLGIVATVTATLTIYLACTPNGMAQCGPSDFYLSPPCLGLAGDAFSTLSGKGIIAVSTKASNSFIGKQDVRDQQSNDIATSSESKTSANNGSRLVGPIDSLRCPTAIAGEIVVLGIVAIIDDGTKFMAPATCADLADLNSASARALRVKVEFDVVSTVPRIKRIETDGIVQAGYKHL